MGIQGESLPLGESARAGLSRPFPSTMNSLLVLGVLVPGVHFAQLFADGLQLVLSMEPALGVEVGTVDPVLQDPVPGKGAVLNLPEQADF